MVDFGGGRCAVLGVELSKGSEVAMKKYLVQLVLAADGRQAAAEFFGRPKAVRVAHLTWTRGHASLVVVLDPDGDVVWARGMSSRVGGRFVL